MTLKDKLFFFFFCQGIQLTGIGGAYRKLRLIDECLF